MRLGDSATGDQYDIGSIQIGQHWQVRFRVATRLLPFGQRDVAVGEGLVGNLAEQVADDVEPAAPLVVGVRDIPALFPLCDATG